MVRKFGKIVVKPSKANPKWIEASYLTPVSAFSEWPDLPNRQTATFPCTQDGRDEAAAWLTRARRRIEADVWEPERIVKRKAKDTALTFGEYAAKWLETREGEGLHVNTIYGIRCTVKRLID
ncbi:phage integrase family protein, partial [Bifidobacterium adolescentis]